MDKKSKLNTYHTYDVDSLKRGFTMTETTEHNLFIDAPLEQYKKIYKDLHNENVTHYIDDLIEKSKVDVELNRETVKKIRKLESEHLNIVKHIRKQNGLYALMVILVLAGFGAIVYAFMTFSESGFNLLVGGLFGGGLLFIILPIILIFKKIRPKLKELKKLKNDIEMKIKEQMDIAWDQMKPLNELFTFGMAEALFQKTIPFIKLDKMFDSKRLDYLINKFGLSDEVDLNRSTLFVQSGEINGNPFYISDDLVHHMGTKDYSGSITIHWTTTSTVNGKRVTNHHTQVLTATVSKPYPMYEEQPYLVYGNDAAPDLTFSRQDSDAEHMSEKQIDRMVNKEIRKLEKKSEKSITKGQNYTVLGNSEFEVLFGATNRNHELQFRLLFTPLAQKQLLELMKEKEIGFGDNFDFVKKKKINIIYPEHLADMKFNIAPSYFHGYDIDQIKKNFIDYNNQFFRYIYFTFAPILAIPLYQQQVPQEYIYKDLYDSYVSFYEHERVVNMMNVTDFKHPLSVTRDILKTTTVKSKDHCDTIKVTAYGYRSEERIDYVQKFGGDGRSHTIPVHWTEYLPVQKETVVAVDVVEEEKEETFQDKFRKVFEDLKNRETTPENLYVVSRFIAHIVDK